MNKQEAIETIEAEWLSLAGICLQDITDIINTIDEPQKPVIPKFVAEWVDDSMEYRYGFDEWFDCNNQPEKVYDWLNPENKRQAELNALALVTLIVNGADAVEIEKEKLYTVEIPNPHSYIDNHSRLARNYKGKVVLEVQDWLNTFESYKLTEAEIKQDFEWAWQFAKEVE